MPAGKPTGPIACTAGCACGIWRICASGGHLVDILNAACQLVGRTLRTELAKIIERQADGQTLFVRAGVGWRPGVVGQLTLSIEEQIIAQSGHFSTLAAQGAPGAQPLRLDLVFLALATQPVACQFVRTLG